MPDYITYSIRGIRYNPPAESLLYALVPGISLELLHDEKNKFDSNAIGIWLLSSSIPEIQYPLLETRLRESNQGYVLEDILKTSKWLLGYVPKEDAKALRQLGFVWATGELMFDSHMKPLVKIHAIESTTSTN